MKGCKNDSIPLFLYPERYNCVDSRHTAIRITIIAYITIAPFVDITRSLTLTRRSPIQSKCTFTNFNLQTLFVIIWIAVMLYFYADYCLLSHCTVQVRYGYGKLQQGTICLATLNLGYCDSQRLEAWLPELLYK